MGVDCLILQKTKAPQPAPAVPANKTNAVPIILVPSALTSLLTLFNVKQFLEKRTFQTTDEMRKKANGVKESPVILQRQIARGGTLTFQVLDSVDKMRESDWDRVVAVFTGGPRWQFRGWKWEEPVEIFSKSTFPP